MSDPQLVARNQKDQEIEIHILCSSLFLSFLKFNLAHVCVLVFLSGGWRKGFTRLCQVRI